MSTVFDNLAFLHHDNAIGIPHSGESMGNDKRCHTSQFSLHLVNGSLHFCLVLLVQSASGFVEDEDTGLLDESSGKSDSLFLTSRKLATAGTDISVDACSSRLDEIPSIGLPQSLLDFSISGVGFAHQDVLLDGRVEEHGLLADVSNLLAVVAEVDVFEILAINEHSALVRVIETLSKLNSG
jgi:hypothetical protein